MSPRQARAQISPGRGNWMEGSDQEGREGGGGGVSGAALRSGWKEAAGTARAKAPRQKRVRT